MAGIPVRSDLQSLSAWVGYGTWRCFDAHATAHFLWRNLYHRAFRRKNNSRQPEFSGMRRCLFSNEIATFGFYDRRAKTILDDILTSAYGQEFVKSKQSVNSRFVAVIILAGLVFSLEAAPKPSATPHPAEIARLKAKEERSQQAQEFYNDIHEANPNVTLTEVRDMSSADVRSLYCKTYQKQGKSFAEARAKANALKIWDK